MLRRVLPAPKCKLCGQAGIAVFSAVFQQLPRQHIVDSRQHVTRLAMTVGADEVIRGAARAAWAPPPLDGCRPREGAWGTPALQGGRHGTGAVCDLLTPHISLLAVQGCRGPVSQVSG